MNDQDIVDKLTALKSVKPSTVALVRMRTKALTITPRKRKSIWRLFSFNLPRIEPRMAFAIGIIVLIFAFGLQTSAGKIASNQALIAVQTNRYQKAVVALNLTNTLIIEDQKLDNPKQISASLDLTNAQLADLRLMGEPGKYSKTQCLEAYHQYDELLAKLKQSLLAKIAQTNDPVKKESLQKALAQVEQYDTAAEARIHLY